jgi:UDP-N-acetyl-D-galactosamine dehydrogenase
MKAKSRISNKNKIAIIGLGYVGLPLALEFAKKNLVLGFDIDKQRIDQLNKGIDKTEEADLSLLKQVMNKKENKGLRFSNNVNDLSNYKIFIITVPTPIDEFKTPNLNPLKNASIMVSRFLKKGDIVIYESTVYPGCTEEVCVPLLEQNSGLKFNHDFYCGYSPERINPGDKVNTLTKIKKVTSGSNERISVIIDKLYLSIITAGTHRASSIKVAEASKAIENAQRDINISFVNELSLIFDKLGIDTQEVLSAAKTKWNYLNYQPGLVGGHCIGVDPYYLAHKSEQVGYHPAVILSGRKVNDSMGQFIATKVIKLMISKEINIKKSKVLLLGFTFKENCPDIRNTKVIDVYNELINYQCSVDIYDPLASSDLAEKEYQIKLIPKLNLNNYDSIIICVAHDLFKNIRFTNIKKRDKKIVFDVKSILDKKIVDGRL